MSTYYKHVRMSVVDNSSNVTVLYPESTASDITVSRTNNSNIPSDVTNIQLLSDKLKASAFKNIDSTPTTNSTNVVSSGGVKSAIGEVNSQIATLSNVRAELGAHNWLNLDDSLFRGREGDTSCTFLSTGIEIANATSGTYRVYSFWIKNLKQNTDYILSSDVTKVSGTGRMFIRDANSGTILCDTENISTSKNVSLSFNTGTSTSLYIAFYSATNSAAIGDVKYENLLICLADDKSTVYGEFSKPNTELTKDTKGLTANAFANGAVNELLCDATSNVQTGLTYIVEDDGTVKVSGTNTSNETAQIAVTMSYVNWDSTKRYRISGCPSNGSSNSYRLGLTINKSGRWSRTLTELGDGLEFQLASNETKIKVSINISAGYAISGTLTFKPMITLADVPNSDYAHYVPYCKSNKELTEDIAVLGTQTGVTTGSSSVPNNTWTKIAEVTVPKGPCILHAKMITQAHPTAYDISMSISNDSEGHSTARTRILNGVTSTITDSGMGDILYLNNNTESMQYLWVKHNRGEATNVFPVFEVIQL